MNTMDKQHLDSLNARHLMQGGTSPRVPTSFTLSEKQVKQITEWQLKQIQKEDPYMGPIGGRFSFRFISTSVGLAVVVEDCVTDESEDFTDFDLW
jgi:hypothetical protein